jgi:hypothetical protein
MKYFILLLILFFRLISFSQETISLTDPIIDENLKVPYWDSNYFGSPIYIVNDKYVVYEEPKTRILINENSKSFKSTKQREFCLGKSGVYFKGKLITTDTTGFTILEGYSPYMWKTKNKVFKNETEITGVDAKSLKIVDFRCYKDKDHVYYNDKKIDEADPESFIYHLNYYDKNYVYKNGEIVYYDGERLQSINSRLAKTSKTVVKLMDDNKDVIEELPEIDVKTIKRLSNTIAIDKNNIYHGITPFLKHTINNSDIKVWESPYSTCISYNNNIYDLRGQKYTEYDFETFGLFEDSNYNYDKNGIYNHVYDENNDTIIIVKLPFKYNSPPSSDNTFRYGNYIVYEDQAYLPGADKLYTNLTKDQIATSKKVPYYLNEYGSGMHKSPFYDGVWINDQKTIADASSFKSLGYQLYKDDKSVYYFQFHKKLKPLEGIDTKSAKFFHAGFICDKKYLYWMRTRIISSKGLELLAIFSPMQGYGVNLIELDNYCLFKNIKGYWLVKIENQLVTLRYLGKNLGNDWNTNLIDFKYK